MGIRKGIKWLAVGTIENTANFALGAGQTVTGAAAVAFGGAGVAAGKVVGIVSKDAGQTLESGFGEFLDGGAVQLEHGVKRVTSLGMVRPDE